jgi:DNA-binding MarR family transcriptional regulator
MKRTAVKYPDFYANLSQILAELAAKRTRDLRPLKLDLDHYFILEAVATGRADSEAEMVRRLGRNASFCSRAVDRLVKRGWLKKQPKPRGDDSRFRVIITRKGRSNYQDLQFGFTARVNQRLTGVSDKAMRPVAKQVVLFSQMLSGVREDAAAPNSGEDDAMVQQTLPL